MVTTAGAFCPLVRNPVVADVIKLAASFTVEAAGWVCFLAKVESDAHFGGSLVPRAIPLDGLVTVVKVVPSKYAFRRRTVLGPLEHSVLSPTIINVG